MSGVRESVGWFSGVMISKLEDRIHKGGPEGWRDSSPGYLIKRMAEELEELCDAVCNSANSHRLDRPKVEVDAIVRECADVANFAMMLADVFNSHKSNS